MPSTYIHQDRKKEKWKLDCWHYYLCVMQISSFMLIFNIFTHATLLSIVLTGAKFRAHVCLKVKTNALSLEHEPTDSIEGLLLTTFYSHTSLWECKSNTKRSSIPDTEFYISWKCIKLMSTASCVWPSTQAQSLSTQTLMLPHRSHPPKLLCSSMWMRSSVYGPCRVRTYTRVRSLQAMERQH